MSGSFLQLHAVAPQESPGPSYFVICNRHAALQMAEAKLSSNAVRLQSANLKVLILRLELEMMESGSLWQHAALDLPRRLRWRGGVIITC